jgi:hypothetical protein
MSNGGTVTLPLGSTLPTGKVFHIKDTSGQAGVSLSKRVTIQMSGGDLLDGQGTTVITANWASLTVVWSGTANTWFIL